MTKTAAYVRVSSRAQTYKTQKDAIERAAQARGMNIDRWYCEKKKADMQHRPELARGTAATKCLLQAARQRLRRQFKERS